METELIGLVPAEAVRGVTGGVELVGGLPVLEERLENPYPRNPAISF